MKRSNVLQLISHDKLPIIGRMLSCCPNVDEPNQHCASHQQHPKLQVNIEQRHISDQPFPHRSLPVRCGGNTNIGAAIRSLFGRICRTCRRYCCLALLYSTLETGRHPSQGACCAFADKADAAISMAPTTTLLRGSKLTSLTPPAAP